MIKSFFFRLYNILQSVRRKREAVFPILYNVNIVNESNYAKRALLIYLIPPFLMADDDPQFLSHQNLRQCKQIAGILDELGYVVDAMDRKSSDLLKRRDYELIICDRADFKSIDNSFKEEATKIFLATSENYRTHNKDVKRRHQRLSERRKCEIMRRRRYPEQFPYIAKADAIMGFGNEFIMNTWREVFGGSIYAFNNYGFRETEFRLEAKDFSTARTNFLFFASRSQVQKGLDLLLEIFPKHPELHLYVCSEFKNEDDFCACYYKELYGTPNVHPIGWVKVHSPEFSELVQTCGYVVHPTCSEGQPGSVVQCMYCGVVPLVTKEAGIDTEDFGVTFSDDSLAEIEWVILKVSELPEGWLKEHSLRTRRVAEEKYSEGAFINRWRGILTEVLHGAGAKNL